MSVAESRHLQVARGTSVASHVGWGSDAKAKEARLHPSTEHLSLELSERGFDTAREWVEPEVVRTRAAIEARLESLEAECRSSVDILVKGSALFETAAAAEQRVLERGIAVRCIYERSVLGEPDGEAYLARWRMLGEQQRVVDSVPFRAAVVDRNTVLVPVGEDQSITTLLVIRAGLGEAVAHLFDLLWHTPAGAAFDRLPRPLSAQETGVLALMCEGASDHAIARDLGISVRTVQRRLHSLGRLLEAPSRPALAARAVALGVVTPFREIPPADSAVFDGVRQTDDT